MYCLMTRRLDQAEDMDGLSLKSVVMQEEDQDT